MFKKLFFCYAFSKRKYIHMLENSLKSINTASQNKIVGAQKRKIESVPYKKEISKQGTVFKKIGGLSLIKYTLISILFFVLNNAKIFGVLHPCFYGFFLSFLFLGKNVFYICLCYIFSVIISGANLATLSFSAIVCIFGSAISYIHKKKFKSFKIYLMTLYAFLLGIIYIAINVSDAESFYLTLTNVILNSLCVLCSGVFLRIIRARKLNLTLNVDEVVCGGVLLLFAFCGLQNLNFYFFDLTKFVGILFVFLSASVLPNSFEVIGAIVCGLGAMLCNFSTDYIVMFSCMAVLCSIFKNQSKIYLILSVLICDVLLSFFVFAQNTSYIFVFIPSLIACCIFLFLPNSLLKSIKQIFYSNAKNDALKSILNQNKLQISKKLAYTAEVFYEMDKSFRRLVKGEIDAKTSKVIVCNEVIKQNCEGCSNKNKCLKNFNSELKKVFERLVDVGFEKGRITLVDLPAYLTNRCIKTSVIVNSFNKFLQEYKNYTNVLNNLDASKLLIAEQLGGISYVLSSMAKDTSEVVSPNEEMQKTIKQNLIYENIVPSEVVCFEKDYQTNVVAMIIRNIDFDDKKIQKVLSKVTNCKMALTQMLNVPNNQNLSCLFYSTAPTYDISVGVAQCCKGGEEICGDTHSISKITDDKFMLALCDGMGHGKKANRASELSISLIENFYKAGFDNQTILTSVNSLLNMGREEIFSALDICVVDLKSGEADFIKQGATIGFIKNTKDINKISSNSLPMGILEKVKPNITKTMLSTDDTIVMLSDGVVDAFADENVLQDYILSLPHKTPQELANTILTRAKSKQKNYPNDDMTVVVAKLFFNCA